MLIIPKYFVLLVIPLNFVYHSYELYIARYSYELILLLLFPGLGVCSFAYSLFALLLKFLHFKERPWAFCSRRSLKKSDREGIALITLYKRATVSEHFHHSVKSKVSVSLVIRANRSLEKISIFRMFFTAFPHVMPMPKSPSLPSLFTLSLFFKSDGSDWLFFSRIALSLKKNNRLARKTKEEIPSPGYSHELCFAR